MEQQMIAALAAIDAALGLPEDGCNNLAQTLAEIKRLRDIAREAADAATKHWAEVLRLRAALAKIADWDSNWGPFPENNEAWRAMVVVTAREAVPELGPNVADKRNGTVLRDGSA